MKKPIIGIVPLFDETKESYWMLPGYMKGIEEVGGVPIMLPLTSNQGMLEQLVDHCDGILFTGGHDVNPALYGQEPIAQCGSISHERDEMESKLFRLAVEQNKSILGICRGIQLFNVLLGGTLYQDLPTQLSSPVQHQQQPPYTNLVHAVEVKKNTPLYDITSVGNIQVNSYHHQAIKELSSELCVMATSPDGLVEGVYLPYQRFTMAVQWHPEFCYHVDTHSRNILKEFVRSCVR